MQEHGALPLHFENEQRKMLLYFQNESTAKNRLAHSYHTFLKREDAIKASYQNTAKFIYLLKQGENYFRSAIQIDITIQPLLLFYGMTHLIKALLLLKDPEYPRTTTVLQHGLTTRKKKKLHYSFLEDDVKVQKDGLIPYFAKVYLKQPLTIHKKYKVIELLLELEKLHSTVFSSFSHLSTTNFEDDSFQTSIALNEIIIFNMTIYVLSMLCRYNSDIWGDIFFTFSSEDYYIIHEVIQLTLYRFPTIILNHLYEKQ